MALASQKMENETQWTKIKIAAKNKQSCIVGNVLPAIQAVRECQTLEIFKGFLSFPHSRENGNPVLSSIYWISNQVGNEELMAFPTFSDRLESGSPVLAGTSGFPLSGNDRLLYIDDRII